MCDYERVVGYDVDDDFHNYADNDGMSPSCGRYHDMVATLNILVRTLISMIPEDRLSSFKWCHEFPVGFTTIRQLAYKQRKSLRELRMDQFAIGYGSDALQGMSNQLAVINCVSFGVTEGWGDAYHMGHLAGKQRSSLRHLKLGTERSLAKRYAVTGGYYFDEQREAFDQFLVGLEESLTQNVAFNLTSLRLCGLCVGDAYFGHFATTTITRNLKKLGLESCFGSEVFPTALFRNFKSTVTVSPSGTSHSAPKLTSFTFRHELPTSVGIESLDKFISSFSGLEELFVLLDKTNEMLHPRCFSAQHGPTLKALVWEGRTAPWTNMEIEIDTSIVVKGSSSANAHLDEICNTCPNLVELGIPLDWDIRCLYLPLARLCHLRTLNIRNLPRKKKHDSDVISLTTFTKAAGTQVMEDIFRSRRFQFPEPGKISLFAVGPTTYEAMRTVSHYGEEDDSTVRYLQPTFFHVHHHKAITKPSWRPLLTEVGRKTVNGVRGYTPHMRIFKSYWLK